jgi:hypothetical protein
MNPITSEQGLQMMGGGGGTAKGVPTVLNVQDSPYKAKGDGRAVTDAAITTGTNVLTSATAAFTVADIGKLVNIVGAGAAGALLSTTISGFTNATTVTLTVNAGTTVSGKAAAITSDDGAAFAQALSDAHAAGGGVVYVPQVLGFYGINQLLDVGDDVWLKGGGRTGTRMTWMSDLGAASAGLRTGPNSTAPAGTPSGSNYPMISDLELVGPGDQNSALNVAPCAMPAVIMRDNGRLVQCNCYGWFCGPSFFGNHQKVSDCKFAANMHGVQWAATPASFGNQSLSDIECVGNKFSGFYIHGTNMIDSCNLVNVHLGFQPFGIYKDNNGAYDHGFLTSSDLINFSFEALGNGCLFDNGKAKDIRGIHFHGPGSGTWFNATYKIAALPADYAIVANTLLDCDIYGIGSFQNAGALGFFDINTARNVMFWDAANMIANSTNALPIFKAANLAENVYLFGAYGVRCKMMKVGGATNPVVFDVMYLAQAGNNTCAKDGAGSGGSDIPVGVLQSQVNSGVWGVIAIEGNTQVNMQAALTVPSYVKADVVNRGKAVVGAVGDGGLALGYSDDLTAGVARVVLTKGG